MQVVRRLRDIKGSFAYESGFLVVATVVGNTLGWVYHIFVARMLGVELFGLFGALVGLFYVAMLGGGAFRIEVAAVTARLAAQQGEGEAVAAFVRMGKKFFLVFLVPLVLFIIFARPIASFFHTDSTGVIIVVGFTIFGTLLFMVALGFLQGLQKFRHLAYIGYVLPPGIKLLAGVVLVLAGLKLLGALTAVVLAEFTGLVVAMFPWRKRFAHAIKSKSATDTSVFRLVLPGLVLAFFIAAPTNLDVPLVVHFFSAGDSGIYTCAATFGKIIVFLPIGVSLVMLPMVAEKQALKMPTRDLALQGLLFTFALCAVATLVCWLFPEFFINLFFGGSYLGAAELLSWYSAAMLVFALNLFLVQYAIAVGKRQYIFISGLATLVIILTISFGPGTLHQVIKVMLIGNLVLLLLCSPLLIKKSFSD